MKHKQILLVTMVLLTAWGCQPTESSQTESAETKQVYTTNYPLYYMTERMVPSGFSVHFPIPGSQDPAHWQPPVDTIASMQQADLIITNGASYEQWMLTVSLPDQKIINTTAAFQDQLLDSDKVITHSHGDEGEHEHLGTAFTTWMDLELAKAQAGAIRDALIKLTPADEALIERQYQGLSSDLSALDQRLAEAAAKISQQVAYSHPVFQYFQQAYELRGPSLHWEPDEKLTEEQLHDLEHLMEHQSIVLMIWEAAPLPENTQILEELGVKSIVIYPMGNVPEQGDWLEGLNQNLAALEGLIE
jgi:zinc transport system substrate-binding protein